MSLEMELEPCERWMILQRHGGILQWEDLSVSKYSKSHFRNKLVEAVAEFL